MANSKPRTEPTLGTSHPVSLICANMCAEYICNYASNVQGLSLSTSIQCLNSTRRAQPERPESDAYLFFLFYLAVEDHVRRLLHEVLPLYQLEDLVDESVCVSKDAAPEDPVVR